MIELLTATVQGKQTTFDECLAFELPDGAGLNSAMPHQCQRKRPFGLEPGKPGSVDMGGSINLLTNPRLLSKNAPGMTPNSCLIEIEKWEG